MMQTRYTVAKWSEVTDKVYLRPIIVDGFGSALGLEDCGLHLGLVNKPDFIWVLDYVLNLSFIRKIKCVQFKTKVKD